MLRRRLAAPGLERCRRSRARQRKSPRAQRLGLPCRRRGPVTGRSAAFQCRRGGRSRRQCAKEFCWRFQIANQKQRRPAHIFLGRRGTRPRKEPAPPRRPWHRDPQPKGAAQAKPAADGGRIFQHARDAGARVVPSAGRLDWPKRRQGLSPELLRDQRRARRALHPLWVRQFACVARGRLETGQGTSAIPRFEAKPQRRAKVPSSSRRQKSTPRPPPGLTPGQGARPAAQLGRARSSASGANASLLAKGREVWRANLIEFASPQSASFRIPRISKRCKSAGRSSFPSDASPSREQVFISLETQ